MASTCLSQALTAVSPGRSLALKEAVASKEPRMAAEVLSCLSKYLADSEVRFIHGLFDKICYSALVSKINTHTRSHLAYHCARSPIIHVPAAHGSRCTAASAHFARFKSVLLLNTLDVHFQPFFSLELLKSGGGGAKLKTLHLCRISFLREKIIFLAYIALTKV